MQQVLFTIVTDANFVAILATDGPTGTNLIQGSVSMGGFTYYITANTARPATSVYTMMLMPNGSFIANQSKLPALTPVHTFSGWAIPA
jgi:hypothetical protein